MLPLPINHTHTVTLYIKYFNVINSLDKIAGRQNGRHLTGSNGTILGDTEIQHKDGKGSLGDKLAID